MAAVSLITVGQAIGIVFDIAEYAILARIILSWFVRDEKNPFAMVLAVLTDPIIKPVSNGMKKLGLQTGGLDFTPLFSVILLRVLRMLVFQLLNGLI